MTWVALHVLGIYLLVAFLAGWIAYLGNKVGRKIGRSKMSVLGLRPRHTSNFITVLTGSVIAVTTLSLFALFSEPVRALLTGIDVLEKRLNFLQSVVSDLETKVAKGRIVYGIGEPILLGTLNPSLGPQQLRAQISAALSAANAHAISRNDTIAAQKEEPPLSSASQLLECSDAAIDEFIKKQQEKSEVLGIRVSAAQNCLYKEKVPVKLETMPVSRVFRQGETVASRRLVPQHPRMLREWYDFLEDMRSSALRKGMIPINDSLGGGLSPEDLDRVSSDLDHLRGPGELVAVARRDLYQTSPLDVSVEVRLAPAASATPSREGTPVVSRAVPRVQPGVGTVQGAAGRAPALKK